MMYQHLISSCETCQFYRPQASFVDAYKDFDRNPPREPLMKSLLDLRKDETQLQENEMELQLELLMTEQKVWPKRPRFAPLCVFPDGGKDGLFIPAIKGRDCERMAEFGADHYDYKPALNRQGYACRTCQFLVRPETKIGDRQKSPTGVGGSQETAFYRQINKEQEDADAMALALEVEQSFIGDGCLPSANFLPTCAIRVTDGRKNTAPFCNLRNDCKKQRPHVMLPTALLNWVAETAKQPDQLALDYTIKIAQSVTNSDVKQPTKFVSELAAWVREDPTNRWSVAMWASSCLNDRWNLSANLPTLGSSDPLSNQWGAPPKKLPPLLQPFIAGCDAYEWGCLAAFSKSSEENQVTAAAVMCQQLAEFLVTVISPFEAAWAIDAVSILFKTENLFSPRTIDLAVGFIERLHGEAERLRLAAQTDLQQHFEVLIANLSYKMGTWLELDKDPLLLARLDAIDEQLGKKVRQQIKIKLDEAHAEGTQILEELTRLSLGTLSESDREALLNNLSVWNDSALERDQQDTKDTVTDGVNALAERSGIAQLLDLPLEKENPTFTFRTRMRESISHDIGFLFSVSGTIPNSSRQVLATLLLHRGITPVTPTAIELYKRHPQPGRIAESIEQALSDPVTTTVEALHKALFGSPSSTSAQSYLSSGRRIGVPQFLP